MADNLGKRYTKEMKEVIVQRMMPPNNEKVSSISKELGITEATLYKWRKEARMKGNATPGDGQDKSLRNGVVRISSWLCWKRTQ